MILTCHGQLVKNQCTNRSIDMNNKDIIIALPKGRILKQVSPILDNIDTSKFINLLSVNYDGNEIILNFSSNVTIKLLVEKIEIFLDDLDMPWPTDKRPVHEQIY